jgi:hypothetical protein
MNDLLTVGIYALVTLLGFIWTSFLVWSLCSMVIWLVSGEVK